MAIKIGLVGTGTVGSGCLEIMTRHRADFLRHYGVDIEVARVCSREPQVAEKFGLSEAFTADYKNIINDPEIDIVVELVGGTTFAHDVVCDALKAGKNVVTANKALMAEFGEELFGLAEASNVELAFEASVGGGIPIISPMKHSLISNEIESVMGIVNGTTNYMLTRMDEAGLDYDAALAEAQTLGYAEADPSADVDGLDAAAKIAILASIAFNSRVTINDVYTEGIRNVSPTDLEAAEDMGYCIKLLAIAHRTDKGMDVRVHPTMIPLDHQLATVNGVDNAIYVVGDAVGETMFFGAGAGSGPAASAVMGDVIEVARHVMLGIKPIVGCTCTDEIPLVPIEELQTKYYIRFHAEDRPGVLAAMAQIFADHSVSVRSVLQRGVSERHSVDLVYVTHTATERDVQAVIKEIGELDNVLCGQTSLIRVEG